MRFGGSLLRVAHRISLGDPPIGSGRLFSSSCTYSFHPIPSSSTFAGTIKLTIMKKTIALLMPVLFAAASQAQLGSLLNKAKNKVQQRVDNKVDKAMDNTLDKAEGKTSSQPVTQPAATASATEAPVARSFAKYDFIPGEKIVYYESLEQESPGELPTGWNTNGTGEVVQVTGMEGKWLRLHSPFIYLSANKASFSENYTVEFDIIMQLKNNGWMYPEVSFGLFSSNGEDNASNEFLKEYHKNAAVTATLLPAEFKGSKVKLESFADNKPYFKSEAKPFALMEQYYGRPMHVAIQVQKERFRVWINEEKAFDVPKGVPAGYEMNQLQFEVHHTNYKDEQYGIYISNIKVAKGVPDNRHKLIEEGKFSTTAILFDRNAAIIRPESGGVLKEIATVLNEYKDVRIKIIGHTDSDGSDVDNLALSQKRSAAIKDALAKDFGIDAARIDTDGKGEAQPVADNKTKEGKALNRRVEFIKL